MRFEEISKYKFIEEPRYYFYGWSKSPKIVGRPATIKALAAARRFLPHGYNFKIWDLQRTREIQLAMIASFYRRLQKSHPNWNKKRVEQEVFVFSAKAPKVITKLNTHRLGGAVDLTIVDRSGAELYMGTDHDDLTRKAALDYYENKPKLSALERLARQNRRLLKRVMLKAGFEPYAPEWWHWGYSK